MINSVLQFFVPTGHTISKSVDYHSISSINRNLFVRFFRLCDHIALTTL